MEILPHSDSQLMPKDESPIERQDAKYSIEVNQDKRLSNHSVNVSSGSSFNNYSFHQASQAAIQADLIKSQANS